MSQFRFSEVMYFVSWEYFLKNVSKNRKAFRRAMWHNFNAILLSVLSLLPASNQFLFVELYKFLSVILIIIDIND